MKTHPARPSPRLPRVLAALAALPATPFAIAAPADLSADIATVQRDAGSLVRVSTLAQSREGRPIPLLTTGSAEHADANPAILILAGVRGDHQVGTDVALELARRLPRDHAPLLDTTTFYIVPRLAPDAAAIFLDESLPARDNPLGGPPVDDDRDRRTDEDPPEDLNGDGFITMMRVKDPPPWLPATHIADADDPRLVREADATKGEVANYALLPEGVDNDEDGRFNEDAQGGVDLSANFPHRWPEHEDGAGPWPLSEPESLALVEWARARENIVAVVVFDRHDWLSAAPESSKMDITGKAPVGIMKDDAPFYEKVRERFTEITGHTGGNADSRGGAPHEWAYAQYGAWAFSTPVWARPEGKKPAADDTGSREADTADDAKTTDEVEAQPERPSSRSARRARGGAGKNDQGDDAKWLAYSDDHRDGSGFIEWEPFDHPQLGAIEIGGFVPGFRTNPPDEDIDRLAQEQTDFFATLAEMLPRVTFDEPIVERVSDGLHRVRLRVRNTGALPTTSAMAVRAESRQPIVAGLDLPDGAAIVGGDRLQRVRTLPPGGSEEMEWMVASEPGAAIRIVTRSRELGERVLNITLDAGANGDNR